ncbi:MAG: single-stranded DNA-binding protein [Malacoplasma sp.]
MNKVFLAGRLASDPQQFVTSNGITQSRISIACADNWNRNESYFFPCVAWQSVANFINTYLKKGDPVVVDGKLIRRSYVSKEGKTVYVMEVVIETIRPFGSSKNNSNYNSSNNKSYNSNKKADFSNESLPSENIEMQEPENFVPSDLNDIEMEDDEIVDLDWMKDIKN